MSHNAAITQEGVLYTWGKGSLGRLGHGNSDDVKTPKVVEGLSSVKVVDVDCRDGHTLAVDSEGIFMFSFILHCD